LSGAWPALAGPRLFALRRSTLLRAGNGFAKAAITYCLARASHLSICFSSSCPQFAPYRLFPMQLFYAFRAQARRSFFVYTPGRQGGNYSATANKYRSSKVASHSKSFMHRWYGRRRRRTKFDRTLERQHSTSLKPVIDVNHHVDHDVVDQAFQDGCPPIDGCPSTTLLTA